VKRKILGVFFASILAISLLVVAAPSVLANGGYLYSVKAEVEPLVITINGNPAAGQVFNVGDTLYLEGYVQAYAYIAGPGLLDADIWRQFSLIDPIGPVAYTQERISDYFAEVAAEVSGFAANISLTYVLNATGTYTINLSSDATVDGEEPDFYQSDNAHIQLTFTVVLGKTADLITDSRHNPMDVGDLKVTYDAGVFNVEYILDAPWELVDTHVYIGTNPPSKKNPKKFPYTAGEITFNPGSESSVYIAAHAKIRMQTGVNKKGKPVYTYAEVWAQTGDDIRIGKGNKGATYFEYLIPS
jgi:hypothetical protein